MGFTGKEPFLKVFWLMTVIVNLVDKQVNIYGQEKRFGKNAAAAGKDKNRNQSKDNLKKIMMKN